MKQLCNRKIPDFAVALRAEKFPGLSKTEPFTESWQSWQN